MKYNKIILAALALTVILAGCAPDNFEKVEATPSAENTASAVQTEPVTETQKVVIELADYVNQANRLTVSAKGTVKIMPDVAYATVGVVTQKKKMQDAQSANKDLMNTVFTALKEAGLTDDDLRTTGYSVYPVYDYSSNVASITMYEVNNTVELTIRDIDRVGEFLDIAAANGANTSYSIRFDVLDDASFYNEALTAAMESARTKADTIIAADGGSIVGTLEVTEGYTDTTVYREYPAAAEAALDTASSTPVSAGELEITATVTVVYEIK